MASYSHSRLSTFEQCRQKYKFSYIDKIEVETQDTVEAFMGSLVHKTLEKLYTDLGYGKLLSLDALLKFYKNAWKEGWTDDIQITKKDYSERNYRTLGEKCIAEYYRKYKPFDQMTILGLETADRLLLPDGNSYHVRIDKLACKGDTYYVCDYKTNSRMKSQEEADSDRQLAMYSLWVKDHFKDAKKVILLWHMLAFGKEVTSERTEEQLKALQKETLARIKEIEGCKEYPPNVTPLCDYCLYQELCPAFKHEAELEKKTPEQFKDDDGVKIVDKFALLQAQRKEIDQELEVLKDRLIDFAEQKELTMVYGSNKKASVKEYTKVVYPEDKEKFTELLKKKGLYYEFSSVNYLKLSPKILNGEIDKSIAALTKKEKGYRVSLSEKKADEEDL